MLTITERQREALVVLGEECAEVQSAIAKILRFGPYSRFPDDAPSNTEKLQDELGHVRAATARMSEAMGLHPYRLLVAYSRKQQEYAEGKYLAYP